MASLCSPLDPVDDYCITLDKSVYFPGETVSGKLALVTNSKIECRGVHVELIGRGSARIFPNNEGEGLCPSMFDVLGNYKDRFYARYRKTVWGRVARTLTIDGAGDRAVFGAPWAKDEGVIMVPVPDNGARHVVLRVMDEDLNSSDDKVGEVLIEPAALVAAAGLECFALRRNGKPGYGEAHVQACWADEATDLTPEDLAVYSRLALPGERLLRLSVSECRGLKDFDLFSANDVYCVAYPLLENFTIDEQKPLPSPKGVASPLPAGEMMVPFRFKLPDKLPPSMEENSRTFVRYSIYSHIDIAWRRNPSARALFTVLNKNPIEFRYPHSPQPFYSRVCSVDAPRACCGLLPRRQRVGDLELQVAIPRRGFACGENIDVDIEVTNPTSQLAKIKVQLVRRIRAEGFAKPSVWTKELCPAPGADNEPLLAQPGQKTNFVKSLSVPAVAPTFKGSDPVYMNDLRWLNENPRGELLAPAEGLKGHPVTWSDYIEVKATLQSNSNPRIRHETEITILAFPSCAPCQVISNNTLAECPDAREMLQPSKPNAAVTVVYVPDPQGDSNLCDPDLDTYTFRPEALVWANLVPIVKPENVEPAWYDSDAAEQ